MIPTLGRIVHYCPSMLMGRPTIQAAIITYVSPKPALGPDEKYDGEENAYLVNIAAFTDWGTDQVRNVHYNNGLEPKAGTWSWPPKI